MRKIKDIFVKPQNSILSAASVIMVMIVAARIIGLVKLRVLASFFLDEELSLYFAAFRLPDLIFEVMTFGTLSSAFIPVMSRLYKRDRARAYVVASRVMNLGLVIFSVFALVLIFIAEPFYSLTAPGFEPDQVRQIVGMSRLLFVAQGIFVVSYVFTGTLESSRRFLVPALAPVFYNAGIISGVIFLHDSLGLTSAIVGVIAGALLHLAVQLPFAMRTGFRYSLSLRAGPEVKKIARLAVPRSIELGFLQIGKIVELSLASIISLSAYTHYNFALSAQAFPVGFIGTSLAKAALPTLASQAEDEEVFKKTFLKTLYLLVFLIMPFVTVMVVLRIPVVRLLFGTDIFDWPSTVQTGLVLSTFAAGVPFQAAAILLSRAFYALHNTKTPVMVSLYGTALTIAVGLFLVLGLDLPTWGLATAYASGMAFQAVTLFYLLSKRLSGGTFFAVIPIAKSVFASLVSGGVMFFILKFFDREVWVRRLSFLTDIEVLADLNFQSFVIDTRFTVNLIILTGITTAIGIFVYLVVNFILRSAELASLVSVARRRGFTSLPEETETVAPTTSDVQT